MTRSEFRIAYQRERIAQRIRFFLFHAGAFETLEICDRSSLAARCLHARLMGELT